MGWRGVKNTLPSKALPLWSSSKRRAAAKNGADGRSNGYFSGGDAPAAPLEGPLNKAFDNLRRDEAGDSKDELGVSSSMEYLQNVLGVNIENAELLVAFEIVKAPSVGVITRKGFVDGWKATGVPATRKAHTEHIRKQISNLRVNPSYFKSVYRHTFDVGKDPGQKSLGLENALVYWELLFSHPCREWKTPSHDWFDLWKKFLGEKWTRSVNRDMWNQTLEFAIKTMETPANETLSFWSEDGAWPSVIDDFVMWCWSKGIGKAAEPDMEMTL